MKIPRITLVLALVAAIFIASAVTGSAYAPSVNSIIINPSQPYQTSIWTDRGNYNIGDKVGIGFRVAKASYVYVFSIDANGAVRMIFPNIYSNDNRMMANQTYALPDNNKYNLTIGGPNGTDQLVLISTPSRITDTDWLVQSLNGSSFAPQININITADGFMIQLKSVAISPVFRNNWSSAYTSYTVGGVSSIVTPPPVVIPPISPPWQSMGRVNFTSNPSGARVYVNGVDRGTTPISISNLNYGEYEVNMVLSDYYFYTTKVIIDSSNTQSVDALLTRISGSSYGNLISLLVNRQIIIGYPGNGQHTETFSLGSKTGSVTLKASAVFGMITKIAVSGSAGNGTYQFGNFAIEGEDVVYNGKVLEFDMLPFKVRVTVLDYTTIRGSLSGTIYLDTVRLLLEVHYVG